MKKRGLSILLAALIVALLGVAGYMLWNAHQYAVSEEYYDSLRNTGLMKGAWRG